MTEKDLASFRSWFSYYCRSFYTSNEEDQRNLLLKEEHTLHVCENMKYIAKDLSLESGEALLAETIALFHDIGRFPQYTEYKTFRDSNSVNHAVLGTEVLSKEDVLRILPEHEQRLILQAIKFHNAYAIPDIPDNDALLFMKLIRDADKLDIWRVFVEYLAFQEKERPSAAGLGLPDVPEYSGHVLSRVLSRKMASLSMLKTLNDFILMQLSWVYDLNFRTSFTLLRDRDYVKKLITTLPPSAAVTTLSLVLEEYLTERIHGALPHKDL
ncbi:MAG TPA: HD domain-containing protein [Thermodesulfovibrionales bacterium]|nr:HD domain-containing protein [Thermodesulfovibrionales bacterium]